MASADTLTTLREVLSKTHPGAVLESDVLALHDFVISQPDGAATLDLLRKSLPETTTLYTASSDGGGAFRHKTGAVGSLLNLWFYQRLTVSADGKDFTANLGGFSPGFPVGFLAGDLYYDDVNDINGDYDVQWAAIGPYGGLQFIQDGKVKMTFQAGNVGWSTGIAGGRGSWN